MKRSHARCSGGDQGSRLVHAIGPPRQVQGASRQFRVAPDALVAARAIDRAQVRRSIRRGAGIVLACPASIRSRSQHAHECGGRHGVLNAVSHHHNRGVDRPSVVCLHERACGGASCAAAMLGAVPALVPGAALAQASDWPAKPVTVVVGYAAGGNTDVMARMASKKLTEDLKQSFVVENRIGAGGALAAAYVAQARPTATRCSSPPRRKLPSCRSCKRSTTIPRRTLSRSASSAPGPSSSASAPRSRPRRLPSSWPMRRRARSTTDRAAPAPSLILPARCS